MSKKSDDFLNYAKKKNWDASISIWRNKYVATLNPIDNRNIFEGESETSLDDAIDACGKELKEFKKSKK